MLVSLSLPHSLARSLSTVWMSAVHPNHLQQEWRKPEVSCDGQGTVTVGGEAARCSRRKAGMGGVEVSD